MQLQVETQIYKKDAIGNGINAAGTKADYYITYISPEKGIQVHNQYTQSFDKTGTPPYGNYVQINGDDISMWRANKEKMRLDATALNFYGYNDNNQHLLASYGDGLVLYKPGVGSGADTPVVSINSSGANIDGSVTIGGKIQGDYLNSNIQIGGNNLLIGTAASITKSTTATTSYVTQALYSTSDLKMLSELGFSVDDEITLSFDWKITSASTYGNARIEWYGKTDSANDTYIAPLIYPFATFSASNTSGHVEKTVKLTSATIQAKRLVLRIDNSNLTLTIFNLKLEKGNKATSWSPAPEDLEKSYYGNCETAAATADKQVSCAGFNLKTGAIVGIKFTNGNTCESNITLNINGTGAKMVYFLGQTTGTDSRLNVSLAANAVVSVIYDGTYWRILSIDQTSTMITRIGDNGISIHPSGTTQHRVEINSSGMNVYRNNTSIAEYGTNARIGSANGQRFLINAGSLQAYDSNSNMYFEVTAEHIKYGQNIGATTDDIPTNVSELNNDSKYATQTEADNAAKNAVNTYILDTSSSNGIRVHNAGDLTDFIQINSTDISMWRANKEMMSLDDSKLIFYDGTGTADSNKYAEFGSTIKIYNPTKGTAAVTINSSGATFDGKVQATSGFIGQNTTNGFTIANSAIYNPSTKTTLNSDTIDGVYIGKDGIALGKGSFKVTSTGALTATSATFGGTKGITITSSKVTLGSNCSISWNNVTDTSTVANKSDIPTTEQITKITQDTITTAYVNALEVTAKKVNVSTLSAITANMGELTSGTIKYGTVGSNNSFYLSNADTSAKIGGQTSNISGLRLTVGSGFGVTSAGKLYATGAVISGALTATSLTIDGTNYATDITTISGKATTGYVETAKTSAINTAAADATSKANEAATKATNYITISGDGILVRRSTSDNTNGVTINSDGVRIYRNSTYYTYISANGMDVYAGDASNSVASFGASARIGKDAAPHIAVTSSEIQMWKGASSSSANKLFSISTNNNLPAIWSTGEIWIESGDSSSGYSSLHVSGAETGLQAEDSNYDAGLYVIADEQSIVNVNAKYFQLESGCSLWYLDTAPPTGSQAYDAIWHKSSNGNYGLYRSASSSKRYKEDIKLVEDDRLDPHHLYDIPVMQFKFKEGYFPQEDPYEQNRVNVIGFIAEDVLEHYPQAAIMINDEVENWDERYIIPPMLKLIQEQNERIKELEEQVRSLL